MTGDESSAMYFRVSMKGEHMTSSQSACRKQVVRQVVTTKRYSLFIRLASVCGAELATLRRCRVEDFKSFIFFLYVLCPCFRTAKLCRA